MNIKNYETFLSFRKKLISLFPYASDAAMNLVDALSSFDAKSVIALCLSPDFMRGHDSIARAIQDYPAGRGKDKVIEIDIEKKMAAMFDQYLFETGDKYHFMALDVSSHPRPYAKKLTEKQIVHQNNPTPGQKPIAVGHNDSCLGLTNTSRWFLPLSLKRVPLTDSQINFGLTQVESMVNCLRVSERYTLER